MSNASGANDNQIFGTWKSTYELPVSGNEPKESGFIRQIFLKGGHGKIRHIRNYEWNGKKGSYTLEFPFAYETGKGENSTDILLVKYQTCSVTERNYDDGFNELVEKTYDAGIQQLGGTKMSWN